MNDECSFQKILISFYIYKLKFMFQMDKQVQGKQIFLTITLSEFGIVNKIKLSMSNVQYQTEYVYMPK